jgi:hypothetical protein
VELAAPGLMSLRMVVPAGVPSVSRNSWPVVASVAMKTTLEPTCTKLVGVELAVPGLTSLSRTAVRSPSAADAGAARLITAPSTAAQINATDTERRRTPRPDFTTVQSPRLMGAGLGRQQP